MVRLVFRPYTQIRRSICTSESLRASTRVSSGFALFRHSSPSFGSQHACSTADPLLKAQVRASMLPMTGISTFTFIVHKGFPHPNTRRHVRLLGPCFKTGRLKPLKANILSMNVVKTQPHGMLRPSVPTATYDKGL